MVDRAYTLLPDTRLHVEKREKCRRNISRLVDKQEWQKAYTLLRYLVDELHEDGPFWWIMYYRNAPYIIALNIDNDKTAGAYMIRAFMSPPGSLEASELCMMAASMGHVYAKFQHGVDLLNRREHASKVAGFKLILFAAKLNCGDACRRMSRLYENGEMGIEQNYHLAALWCQRAGELHKFWHLLGSHPMETCPFGIWEPTAELHHLVFLAVHDAMVTWMLVAKRRGICNGVALLIAGYVCTESDKWEPPDY